MNMTMTIADKLRRLIADQLSLMDHEVTDDKRFIDDIGVDSLDIVELIMAVEEEFDLEVPDEDVEAIRTVGDAVAYVTSRVHAGA